MMGFTAAYQFLRAQPLTDAEKTALGALVVRVNAVRWDGESFCLDLSATPRDDGVLAQGITKLSPNFEESKDAERLCAALNEAWKLLPGAELRVEDDHGVFGLGDVGCSLEGEPAPPLIEVSSDAFTPAQSTLPPPPSIATRLSHLLARGAEVRDDEIDEKCLVEAFAAMKGLDYQDPTNVALRALVEQADPVRAVRVAMCEYARLRDSHVTLWRVSSLARAITDVSSLVPDFVAMWKAGEGIYFFHSMSFPEPFEARIAAQPAVHELLAESLAEADRDGQQSELAFRRGERAASLLARAGTDRALGLLLGLVVRTRERSLHYLHEHHVLIPTLRALAEREQPIARCFATFVLELDRMKSHYGVHDRMVQALPRLDRERARPIIRRLAKMEIFRRAVLDAAGTLGDVETLAGFLESPDARERRTAAEQLRALGREAPEPSAQDPAPETLVTHANLEIRHRALRTIHDRKDLRTFLSLALAAELDAKLRGLINANTLPFSWWEWKGLLPEEIIKSREAKQLTWAQTEGRAVLGEQVIFDAVRPLLERGVNSVAAEYPTQLFRLTDEERAAALKEESEILATP